jgi:hypothetical protein
VSTALLGGVLAAFGLLVGRRCAFSLRANCVALGICLLALGLGIAVGAL